jgi:signal peptidase
LVVLLALVLVATLSPFLGWRMDVVQSGSMSPSIGVGDLAVTVPSSPDALHVGDVVTFRCPDGTLVCHRVVEINVTASTLITQGDANEGPDPDPVRFDQVMGRVVVSVPLLGYAFTFLRGPFGWATMGLLVLLLVVTGKGSKEGDSREGGQ